MTTPFDCPNPPHKLEDFVSLVAAVLRRDPSMGDEADIFDIEEDGLYGFRVKLTNGQVFLVRVGVEP